MGIHFKYMLYPNYLHVPGILNTKMEKVYYFFFLFNNKAVIVLVLGLFIDEACNEIMKFQVT